MTTSSWIAQGIKVGDIKKLQDVGIYTINDLMVHIKKSLMVGKSLTDGNLLIKRKSDKRWTSFLMIKLRRWSVQWITRSEQRQNFEIIYYQKYQDLFIKLCLTETHALDHFMQSKAWHLMDGPIIYINEYHELPVDVELNQ